LYAHLTQRAHAVVKLVLAAAVILDLTRITTNNNEVKLRADTKKGVMLFVHVVDQLATHAGIDHPIGEWDGVISVTISAFVSTSKLLSAHKDPNQRALVLWRLWLLEQSKIIFRNSGEA